jgi:hypothetical protein
MVEDLRGGTSHPLGEVEVQTPFFVAFSSAA